jgi:hypothetical protein
MRALPIGASRHMLRTSLTFFCSSSQVVLSRSWRRNWQRGAQLAHRSRRHRLGFVLPYSCARWQAVSLGGVCAWRVSHAAGRPRSGSGPSGGDCSATACSLRAVSALAAAAVRTRGDAGCFLHASAGGARAQRRRRRSCGAVIWGWPLPHPKGAQLACLCTRSVSVISQSVSLCVVPVCAMTTEMNELQLTGRHALA